MREGRAILSTEELRELCVELAATLDLIGCGLASVEEGEWPLPDACVDAMHERDAMAAAIKSLPEDVRAKLRTVYARERFLVGGDYHGQQAPAFIGELEERAADALENVRRARLHDTDLHIAIGDEERRQTR